VSSFRNKPRALPGAVAAWTALVAGLAACGDDASTDATATTAACQDITEFGGTWLVVDPAGNAIR
jgi:hypothetical protein